MYLFYIIDQLYHSLKELSKLERISELGLYFSIQDEVDGVLVTEELIPGGNNELVTNLNYDLFIQKRIEHLILKYKMYINEIKTGIFSVNQHFLFQIIPFKIIKIFNSDEFELLLNGQPFIDVYDWKINTIYKGYNENSLVYFNSN